VPVAGCSERKRQKRLYAQTPHHQIGTGMFEIEFSPVRTPSKIALNETSGKLNLL
jgi:hypothetical protein